MAELKRVIDEFKDIGKIANMMADWKGDIADALELPYPEREKIMEANRGNLGEQKRAALLKWKNNKGDSATFENLIAAFTEAGYRAYADGTRRICLEKSKPTTPTASQTVGAPTCGEKPDRPTGAAAAEPSQPKYYSTKVEQDKLQLIKWTEDGKRKRFFLTTKIADKWRPLGKLLKIEEGQLDGIAGQYQNKSEDCCRAVLAKWLENPPPNYSATWGGLIELLEDCQLQGVAEELEDALSKANI